MSTMATTSTDSTRAEASPAPATSRSGLARPAALVLGGVLFALGMGLHLPAVADEQDVPPLIAEAPDRWMSSHLLMSFGLVLVALALISALPLVRGRGSVPTVVGSVMTALGAVLLAFSDLAHGAVGFALAGPVEPSTSFEVHQHYFEQPAILGLNTGPMLLTLGMIVLGAGLIRSRAVPRWEGAAVLLTPIGVNVALNAGVSTWLHGVPFLVGMVVLARVVARR